jgi:NitT/TauT family transport system substrate-binding protein
MITNVKKRLLAISSALILVVGLLAGCGAIEEEETASQEEKETIKIGYVNILSMASAIIAEKQGLISKQGLESEFYSFANGADLYKALASGKLDIAFAGVPPTVNWASRGAEIKAIAKVGDGKFGLMTPAESAISQASDLKGKKLGTVIKGSGVDLLVRGFLLPEGGTDETQTTLVEMKMPNMEQAILNGNIDAAVAGEPFITFAELRGLKVVKELPDPAILVIAREAYLKEHPEAVKKFISGHIESIKLINEDKKKASEILAKAFNVAEIKTAEKTWSPEEIMEKALERHVFNHQFGESDFEFYQQIADANYKLKMIEKPFEVKSVFDTTWIK